VAFGPAGEVLVLVTTFGRLYQVDMFGTHVLANGVRSASVGFNPSGEVLVEVTTSGNVVRVDSSGSKTITGGALSASITFQYTATEVLDVIGTDGTLTQYDSLGTHKLGKVF
jgi:hypothetical protein